MEGAEGDRRGPLLCFFEKSFRMQPHAHRDETSSTMYCTSMSLSLAAPRPIQSNDKQRHTLFCVEPFELLSHTQPCGKPHAHT